MNDAVKGIIHVHSDYSRDGFHSISEVAAFARELGFQFVGLTDHAEDLSAENMDNLRNECDKHSDGSCVLIPGLEFRCDGDIHILGLGITSEITSTDPVTVARRIQSLGGLAVLAHPGRNGYNFPRELCTVLNGIEIWNAGYDGRFVPPLANLRLLDEARDTNSSILGFGGADLHAFHGQPGIVLELSTNGAGQIDTEVVLQYLREGGFSVYGKYLSFNAHTELNGLMRFPLWAFRKLYELSKAIRDVTLGET